jgi:hypothetical protein
VGKVVTPFSLRAGAGGNFSGGGNKNGQSCLFCSRNIFFWTGDSRRWPRRHHISPLIQNAAHFPARILDRLFNTVTQHKDGGTQSEFAHEALCFLFSVWVLAEDLGQTFRNRLDAASEAPQETRQLPISYLKAHLSIRIAQYFPIFIRFPKDVSSENCNLASTF